MENLYIIYFGNDWAAENKTSSHHISQFLSNRYRLLYVECPGLRMPQRSKRDIGKIFSKIRKSWAAPRQVNKNLNVYTLFQIPLHRFSFVRKLNDMLILFSLNRVMKKLGISDPLLWFHVPHLSRVPAKLKSRGVIYYCIDSFSSLPNVDKIAVQTMDDEMTRIADLVFVSSSPLFDKKKSLARELILSPHGVDFAHFNQSFSQNLPLPKDVSALSKPIIGFWGLIEDRIDLDLIKYIATRNPDWNFVMIGHVAVKENPCSHLENVYFVGAKKYQELPEYGKSFDVAILPYKMNEFVFNCNPIKLREYLATGKPVVSTRYPEIEKYQDVVSIADSFDDFERNIKWYLNNDTLDLKALRIKRVQSESWQNRIDEIIATIKIKFLV